MNKIIENDIIISQFEPGTTNVKQNFVKRNELIAMLSEKIVVVEASKDSCSIFIAKYGVKYEKEIFEVPGNIDNKLSMGTNALIKEGIRLYLSVGDIVKSSSKYSIRAYSSEGKTLYELKSILNIDEVQLFEMEAKGLIKQIGGLFFKTTPGVQK